MMLSLHARSCSQSRDKDIKEIDVRILFAVARATLLASLSGLLY